MNSTVTLNNGAVLTLAVTNGVAVMSGGKFGSHTVEGDEARITAHWRGYVENNGGTLPSAEVSEPAAMFSKNGWIAPAGIQPKKLSLKGPGGIIVTLDSTQIFPADPGNGTPAMVFLPFKGHATFWCAQVEGEVTGRRETHPLTKRQSDLRSDLV